MRTEKYLLFKNSRLYLEVLEDLVKRQDLVFICGKDRCRVMTQDEFESEYQPHPPNFPPLSTIRKARMAQRITQSELAEMIGIDFFTYSKMENGHIFTPKDILSKIASILWLKNADD